jgi:putative hydrolase of the HAD superfamily
MKIQAISFDFWNTLFRDRGGTVYHEARLKYFMETVSAYRECHEQEVIDAFKHASRTCHQIWTEQHRTPNARERIEMVLAQLALELPEEILEPMVRFSGEVIHQFPPVLIEGVADLLAVLAPRYKLAIISDTGFSPGTVLREILKRNGIYDYFDVFTFSDEAGRSKPHQSVFMRTTEALGIRPDEMLHIGDLEMTDIAGAKGVGATAVLFAADTETIETSAADFIVKSHFELLHILERL